MSNNFAFPHRDFTKVIGLPTNASLQVLKSQLCDNAASAITLPAFPPDVVVELMATLGLSWMLLSTWQYPITSLGLTRSILVNYQCMEPVPRPFCVSRSIINFDTDLAAYELYSKVSNTFKRQILLAVEPTFLQTLAHLRLGFMTVTPLVMIRHLDETYSRLTSGVLIPRLTRIFLLYEFNPKC
jgi:hypothetical protein